MKLFNLLFFSILSTYAIGQATNLRTGLWSDATLWSRGNVPNINDTVSLSFDIVIDVNAECKAFNANGHSVTINTGFNLNILGNNFRPMDSIFVDARDRQVYTFKHIGTQVWMTKNLNYATVEGSWCYDEQDSNCVKFGRLYIWDTAMSVAPPGWHLPTDDEWQTLVTYLGGQTIAGGEMKSTTGWNEPNTGATNSSGFTAFPAGSKRTPPYTPLFAEAGYYGNFWCSMEVALSSAYRYGLLYNGALIGRDYTDKKNGFSVRCIRD